MGPLYVRIVLCPLDVDATPFLQRRHLQSYVELQEYADVAVALFVFETNCDAIANWCSPLLLVETTIKHNLCFQ